MLRRQNVTALVLLAALGACSTSPEDDLERVDRAARPIDDPGVKDPIERAEAVAAANEGLRERNAYLAKKYPNERGQSDNWKKTLYAGLLDIYNTAKANGNFNWEYCSQFYTDKYGYFYYTAPVQGVNNPDGSAYCETDSAHILRPEWKALKAYAHSHPLADGVTSKDDVTMSGQLMKQDPKFEFWTIRSNGELYVYVKDKKTGFVRPQLYGKIDKGHIITAFNDVDHVHRPGYDPYAQQPGDDGPGVLSWVWKALVAAWTVSAGVAIAVLGGASTPSDGCCYGPPASGYDPASDPTQVCRRADGSNCQ